MATIKRINPPGTEEIYKRYKYSQAVVGVGRVDVAGQVGTGPDHRIPEDVTEQARNAFTNLKRVLEAAGSSLDHVTQLTQYVVDMRDVPHIDRIYSEFFPDQYPARTVVQVAALVLPVLKVEIQATAVIKDPLEP
jgi:2-iminobutanoate/2-iminopropanoate deaminase